MKNAYKKVLLVLGLLVVIRILIPPVALRVINNLLENKMGTYVGHVNDLDLNLYRGAYELQGLEFKKRGSVSEPLLQAVELDLSLAWRALLRGNVTADVTVYEGKINLADSEDKDKRQIGNEESEDRWKSVLDTLIPIKIETLTMHNSSISFSNRDLKVEVPIKVEKIELEARDLRSSPEGRLSPFYFDGLLQGHAPIKVRGSLNILTVTPEGDLDLELEKFNISTVNPLLRTYVPIDITSGQVNIYSEMQSSDKKITGYFKVLLHDADIIAPKQQYKGIKHFFIELGTAIGNWILKNPKTRNVAMRIPFKLEHGKLQTNVTETVMSALSGSEADYNNRNEKIKPGLDRNVSYKRSPSGENPLKSEK